MTNDGVRKDTIEKVFERNNRPVYRIAYLRTRSHYDAEDIMQEVFLRYLKSGTVFESPEHEKAWFIRTTINRTNSFFSSAWRKNTVPLDGEISISDDMSESEILDAVMRLPKDISTAIHLHYYESMSVKEISESMGKSESAVKSLLFRGRKLLKISLDDTCGKE